MRPDDGSTPEQPDRTDVSDEGAPQMGEPGYLPDHTAEWREEYTRTTPGQRVAEAIALSRFQTRIASAGRARRGR